MSDDSDLKPSWFSQFDGPFTVGVSSDDQQHSSSSIPSIPSIQGGSTSGGVGGGGGGGAGMKKFGSSPATAAMSFAEAAASAASPNRPDKMATTMAMNRKKNHRKNSDATVDSKTNSQSSNNTNDGEGTHQFSSSDDAGAASSPSAAKTSSSTSSSDPTAQDTEAESSANTTPQDDGGADQERQILLLVLLAQVCAMHDATPRTFTVHVLDLYERGLLDRESIQFLFELGLVPSTSTTTGPSATDFKTSNPPTGVLTSGAAEAYSTTEIKLLTETETEEESIQMITRTVEDGKGETALTTTNTTMNINTTTVNLTKQKRIIETKAIRRQLSLNDQQMPNPVLKSNPIPKVNTSDDDNKKTCNNSNDLPKAPPPISSSIHDNSDKPWEVEHFPLSLSRYQREFREVKLLNKGSFGQVFHCVRMLDGCDYAIKKIVFDARGYESKNIQRVMREVECLASVSDHPNVVHYYTSWLEPSWMTGNINNADGNGRQQRPRQRPQQQYLLQGESGPGRRESPSNRLLRDLQNLVQHTSNDFSSNGNYDESSLFDRDDRRGSASIETVDEDSWDPSYQSYSLESYDDAMGNLEPFSWDDPTDRRASRAGTENRSGKKKIHSPYQYQIFLFIQMQLCHPATLADWIRERNKQIPDSDHERRIGPALDIFNQIVCGLAHIHEKGIIHRDMKPANIFASKDGREVLIGDFGLSKQLREMAGQSQKARASDAESATRTAETEVTDMVPSPGKKKKTSFKPEEVFTSESDEGNLNENSSKSNDPSSLAIIPADQKAITSKMIIPIHHSCAQEPLTAGIGTATYAAPEQVRTKTYGTAVDIFSLGLILLELVCCFETEHERLDWFNRLRTRRCVPPFLEQQYPQIASTILACTRTKASERPSARELSRIYKVQSLHPRTSLEMDVQHLQEELVKKDKELAEKDEIIETMRLEMEKMKLKMSKSATNDTSTNGQVTVEDAETFEEEDEEV